MQLEVGEAIGDGAGLVKDVDTLILFKESGMFVDLGLDSKNNFPEI